MKSKKRKRKPKQMKHRVEKNSIEEKNNEIEEISIDGKSIGTIEGSDKVFKVKPRKDIIQQVVDRQQNRNFKKGHTKVEAGKGSRKKIVQQKVLMKRQKYNGTNFCRRRDFHDRVLGKTAVKKLNKKVRKLV